MIIKDYKKVSKISMSLWAGVAGLLVLVMPELIFKLTGIDSDPVFTWWLGILLILFSLIGRFFDQTDDTKREWGKIIAILVVIFLVASFATKKSYASECEEQKYSDQAALDIAVPLIAKWEGLRLNAYLDIVNVPTICYGSTRGVYLGMRKTREECDEMLREEVKEYRIGWLDYVNVGAIENHLTPQREAAYTSLAYNVGIHGAGKSTATRRLNSGRIVGGCHAIGWWNKAGQRVVRGLVNRRAEEVELCLIGAS